MPRIDPLQLLNCLNVLLTPNGGIKSEQEVSRISSLMEKFSKKLVSKCVYLLILKASDVHLLSMFMASGGWNLIYSWLVHAVEAKNYPFLIELLEVIIICPVDIERLKSNPMPRQIKYLSKDNAIDSRVKDLASDIVKHWLAIVKGAPTPQQGAQGAEEAAVAQTANDAGVVQSQAEEAHSSEMEYDVNDVGRVSPDNSPVEEEREEDTNYVKSTSPSSSSLDSEDDSDVFVPYKKTPTKKKLKGSKGSAKKEKGLSRKSSLESSEKSSAHLKSKLVNDVSSKDPKKASIKLKIEKKKDDAGTGEHRKRDKTEEKTLEEKLKEKRRLKDQKERDKFARLKEIREKKEQKHAKDKDKRSEKSSKEKQEDKAKGDLAKLIPKSIEKLGRIPKLSKDASEAKNQSDEAKRKEESTKSEKPAKPEEKKVPKKDDATKLAIQRLKEERDRKAKEDAKKASAPVPPKKSVSMSVEKRFAAGEQKPKTVKAYNSKFRLTGLEEAVTPKPPSRKPNAPPSAPATMSTSDKNALKRSPTKDVESEPAEKKMKSPDISFEEKSPVLNKNKKPFLQESDDFMNAMNAAVETQKELLRKRKKSASKNEDATSPTAKTSENNKESKPFSFYKDTMESSMDEGNNDSVVENRQSPDDESSPKEKETSADEENKPPVIKSAEGLKSALALFRTRKHPKKSVKWKTEDELEAVQYFEVDVSERANVVKDFWAMQMKERSGERESMLMARKTGDNDKMVEQIAWKKPVPIDITPPSTVRGANSQEKNIQYARERAVPPALYYSKSMIPDSPAEPDLEIHPTTVPPVIPLDDISGSQDSVNDFSNYKWPEPKLFPPDGSEFMPPNFLAGAVPPPMFPPFPDGTFPPPFTQPFFPAGPVPPNANWAGTGDQSQQSSQTGQPMQWIRPPFDGVPPPNMVPPVGPGMIGPPPFGMMAPVFPFPGAPPNMFPPPGMAAPINNGNSNSNNNSDNPQFSPNSGYSNNSDGGSKKWNNDDRFHRKDSWKNNYSSDRRDKRGSSNWRGSGGNSRLCKYFQKKGYCNSSGCRFYHPEK